MTFHERSLHQKTQLCHVSVCKSGISQQTYRHCHAAEADIRTQSFAYPCCSPKRAERSTDTVSVICTRCTSLVNVLGRYAPRLVPINPRGKDAMKVSAGADEEQHDQEEGLELEDAEHDGGFLSRCA